MMPQLLRQFATLGEPMRSPSGEWALCYDTDGRAVIRDHAGTVTWAAGAVGTLRLELDGIFAVYDGDQVVWRADYPKLSYTSLRVTDDGDGMIYDDGFPKYSLRHGAIEPVSLGDRAPLAEISGNRFLESGNGKRTVHRTPDGSALVHRTSLGPGAAGSVVVQPDEVRTLEQPNTWLTWRFLESGTHSAWTLVLVGPDDEIRWTFGTGHATDQSGGLPPAEPAEPTEPGDGPEWLASGLEAEAYCVTVIHNVDPDEALRRFGASDEEISTATWAQLQLRASYEDAHTDDSMIVAAFKLGPHALLVEDNGYEAADRPDLSRGTFAVSTYCSINADHRFLVSRDGETLATFQDFLASDAEGTYPEILTDPLAEMGIDDIEEFDSDDDNFLDDLELLSQLTGLHPEIEDVTGPAWVAILNRIDVHKRVYGSA